MSGSKDKYWWQSRSRTNKVVKENHLDFLYELHQSGIDLTKDQLAALTHNGYFAGAEITEKEEDVKGEIIKPIKSTAGSKAADRFITIISETDETVGSVEIITDKELEERRIKNGFIFRGGDQPIIKKDWMPDSTTEHTKEFIDFITSINSLGFKNRTNYHKFNLYVQQAYTWLAEKKSYTDIYNADEREEFLLEELRRCDENALYWLDKYVYYKEGNAESGKAKYTASPVHAFMAYLDNCGYSVALAKGRQIAATTTLTALDVHDAIFKPNHFMKFITEDEKKAEEIFDDKLKYCFSELPHWMRPNVLNERDNFFKLGYKEEKGDKSGVNSTIRVVPPKRTAIAGGAPNKVKVDEAGNVGILTVMLNNARPTMFWFNPVTRKLEMKRQLWFWGTGGEQEKGGMAFQTEMLALMKQWSENNFNSGIIPIFLDWTCRPGATQEDYDREKEVAYSKVGPDHKKSIIEFHQTWPRTLSDVFMSSEKTLVSMEFIDENLERITKAKIKHNFAICQRGYFEPIFDTSIESHEGSDVPYKIVGANFVPTEDIDQRASVTIFSHPKREWKHRYFSGTDPISSNTGTSDMASAVYDKYFKTLSAVVDFRTKDYNEVFLQCLLLQMYYGTEIEKTKELVETNIGTAYIEYCKTKKMDDSFVLNYELPPHLQNRTTINEGVGIDNKGLRSTSIVNHLSDFIRAHGDNVYIEKFWHQLKTFVSETTDNGKETWGPVNRKYFKDDILFAAVYAYICAELVYYDRIPVNISEKAKKVQFKTELQYDNDFNLTRVTKKVSG